jgi:hypothetical protein
MARSARVVAPGLPHHIPQQEEPAASDLCLRRGRPRLPGVDAGVAGVRDGGGLGVWLGAESRPPACRPVQRSGLAPGSRRSPPALYPAGDRPGGLARPSLARALRVLSAGGAVPAGGGPIPCAASRPGGARSDPPGRSAGAGRRPPGRGTTTGASRWRPGWRGWTRGGTFSPRAPRRTRARPAAAMPAAGGPWGGSHASRRSRGRSAGRSGTEGPARSEAGQHSCVWCPRNSGR